MRGFITIPSFAAFALATGASAGVAAQIALNSSPNVKPGESFVVSVDLTDASGAVGAQLRVNFDGTKVVLDSIDAGDDFPLKIYSSSTANSATFATGGETGEPGIVLAVPAKRPVTCPRPPPGPPPPGPPPPPLLTAAIVLAELVQAACCVTFCVVESSKSAVACSDVVSPAATEASTGLTCSETGNAAVTVTYAVAVNPSAVAVMVAVPADRPVT
jgi:hypothetical protein